MKLFFKKSLFFFLRVFTDVIKLRISRWGPLGSKLGPTSYDKCPCKTEAQGDLRTEAQGDSDGNAEAGIRVMSLQAH